MTIDGMTNRAVCLKKIGQPMRSRQHAVMRQKKEVTHDSRPNSDTDAQRQLVLCCDVDSRDTFCRAKYNDRENGVASGMEMSLH